MTRTDGAEDDALAGLQDRLVAGERTAGEPFCRLLLLPLFRYLTRKFPHADRELLDQAAADALIAHLKHPSRYSAAAGKTLRAYLEMIAWRKAANLVRGEGRRQDAERRVVERAEKPVAEDPLAGKSFAEEVEAALRVLPDDKDRAFMRLLAAGVTDARQLGDALGLPDLSKDRLTSAVKRARDRIRKTLSRKGSNR